MSADRSTPIRLCLVGASGRVGQKVLEILPDFPEFSLSGAIVEPASASLGKQVLPDSKVLFSDNFKEALALSDAVLDFSSPAGTNSLLKVLQLDPKPTLIGTTAQSEQNISMIGEISRRAPILIASNTSIGIFVMEEISKLAQKILGPQFDIEIVETHRSGKQDAPSGTALTLAKALCSSGRISNGREALRESGEITIHSLRGGDVAGEHSIHFLGSAERIEITHRVSDRGVFARGALRLLSLLVGRTPDRYTPRDLFEGVYSLL